MMPIHGTTIPMTSDGLRKPDLPPYGFINTTDKWLACLQALGRQRRIAIDLEANSMYAYRERICLVQISTASEDFIVDPLAITDPEPLGALIQDPAIEKVFHSAEYDLKLLKREFGWQVRNLFDTMWAARILGIERVGLASLLADIYQVRLDKHFQRADWCRRPLSRGELAYAQADTHYLLGLRDHLAAQLEAGGYTEEAFEIFAEQSHVAVNSNHFDPDSFWSINGVKELDPQGKAILKALNEYRHQEAAARDKPLFKVLSDRTLVEMAHSRPHNLADLSRIHGMTPGQTQRYGRHILRIITEHEGTRAPARPKRAPKPADAVFNRYERLHIWRKERGRVRHVESDVILSREALWELANANPRTLPELEASGILGPFRLRTYGPELVRLLSEEQ